MNVAADKFVEYNSVDTEGNVVSPASNIVTFTKDATKNEMETILTAEEATEYTLDKVFPDWTPAAIAAQKTVENVSLADNTLTWGAVEGAAAYAIISNGEVIAIVDAATTSYAVSDANASYAVRAANEMGGFGEAVAAGSGTAIRNLNVASDSEDIIHTIGGIRISKANEGGVYIINGQKIVK